jgi:hypothetical protein
MENGYKLEFITSTNLIGSFGAIGPLDSNDPSL